MRLNVLDLTLKIQEYRPKVVCFVGKKIWDVYESVVIKTARSAPQFKLEANDVLLVENVKPLAEDVKALAEDVSTIMEDVKPAVEHVKLEVMDVKAEPVEAGLQPTLPGAPLRSEIKIPLTPSPPAKKSKKIPTTPFQFASPRPLRLPFPDGNGYTYFWVSPNTSGLERTPVGRLRSLLLLWTDSDS